MSIRPTPKTCCGCMACKSVCPVQAISISTDEKGFIYPQVNQAACMDCSACDDICAFSSQEIDGFPVKKAYSFQIQNPDDLFGSTSGGAFTAISNLVLDDHGAIVAAIMDSSFNVLHCIGNSANDRDAMRLSKYVQSNTDGIFEKVAELLRNHRKVLFVGTPCQVSQMSRFLGNNRDNILLCDFICHGVPNNKMFKDHIQQLENRYQKKIAAYSFRGKRFGWNHGIDEIEFSDHSRKYSFDAQSFTQFFQDGVSLRASCRTCKYRSGTRCSDITIADFWGIEKITGKADRRGVSLVMINSEKGQEYVYRLREAGSLEECSVDAILPRLNKGLSGSKINADDFWNTYREDGYSGIVTKYTDRSWKKRTRFMLKKTLFWLRSKGLR